MKAIGFNGGQFGDICMGMVAARAHKEQFPDSQLYLGMSQKYAAIAPLFENNLLLDGVHVWENYHGWPSSADKGEIALKGFDKVYNAMPNHTTAFWYLSSHQTAEMCKMHELEPPSNLKIDLNAYWNPKRNKFVALSLFGETRGGQKSVTLEQAKNIVGMVKKMGYDPLQLGLESEPRICENRLIAPFVKSVEIMTTCQALITVDTAMAWIASGYSVPTIGLYGYSYYPMAKTSVNWQPVNPNAIYVESAKVSDIILERIEEAIKSILP